MCRLSLALLEGGNMTATMTPNAPPAPQNGASAHDPVRWLPPTDQEKFDAEVARDGGIFLHVLGAVGIMAAIVISTIALVVATQAHTSTMVMPSAPVAVVPSVPAAQSISLSVAGGNKLGPDGKMHDSFSKTNFAVKVGQPTRLVVDNKDSGPHSITAPGTGVSI